MEDVVKKITNAYSITMGASFGFTCSVCGKEYKGELAVHIGDLKNVCNRCYAEGVAWAVLKAHKARKEIK